MYGGWKCDRNELVCHLANHLNQTPWFHDTKFFSHDVRVDPASTFFGQLQSEGVSIRPVCFVCPSFFFCSSAYLYVNLFVWLSLLICSLFIFPPDAVHLFISLSICAFAYLCIYMSIDNLLVGLSVVPSVCLFIYCMVVHPAVPPSIFPSILLLVSHSVCTCRSVSTRYLKACLIGHARVACALSYRSVVLHYMFF